MRHGRVKDVQLHKDASVKGKRELMGFLEFLDWEGQTEYQEKLDLKVHGDPKEKKDYPENLDLEALKVTEESMVYQVLEEPQEYQ